MKWIYNPNAGELINTDTGSMFKVRDNYISKNVKPAYESYVYFQGPPAGYEDGVVESTLFEGAKAECQAYLRDLAGQFDAHALPEGNGTPYSPKEEVQPIAVAAGPDDSDWIPF